MQDAENEDYGSIESIHDQFLSAVAEGNVQECKALFNNNRIALGDLNLRRHSLSPLCYAAQAGRLEVVEWLLDNGALIDKPDGKGCTALLCALMEEQHHVMKYLLQRGCSIHASRSDRGSSLAHSRTHSYVRYAVQHNQLHSLQLLINYGCDVNEFCGDTPLHQACKKGLTEVVRLLLDAGADVNSKVLALGFTPLHVAVTSHNPQIVDWLAAVTEKPALSGRHQTPVYLAATCNNAQAIHILAAHGWDLNTPSMQGDFPLIESAIMAKMDAFKALVDCGCDVNQVERLTMQNPEDARHILHTLPYLSKSEAKAISMATYLLDAGCQVNTPTLVNKETPLHIAASLGKAEFVSLYLRHGADYTLKDEMAKTAFVNAVWGEKWDVCKVFLDIGAQLQNEQLVIDRSEKLLGISLSEAQMAVLVEACRCVPSLCHMCSLVVREHLGLPFRSQASKLPVPAKMREFICMDYLQ